MALQSFFFFFFLLFFLFYFSSILPFLVSVIPHLSCLRLPVASDEFCLAEETGNEHGACHGHLLIQIPKSLVMLGEADL